jgi:glutaredoxin 3
MSNIVIYSTAFCPYCDRAKSLLKRKGVEYEEIRIDQDRERMVEMMERSQRRTVPQIFIGDVHDMSELDMAGKLDDLLCVQPSVFDNEVT